MRGVVLAALTAASVLVARPARADLSTATRRQVSELCTRSASAAMRADGASALRYADQAVALDAGEAWAHYDRAVALGLLGRVDEAVVEYRVAQGRFGSANPWGRSISVYGRAHLYAEHQRCEEAEAAYEEFADLVGKDAPKEAEMALSYASDCPLPAGARPAVSSNTVDAARVALAEARRREAYAATLDRWVKRLSRSSVLDAQPDARARLSAVRERAEKLAATARSEEHAAQAELSRTR